MQVIAILISLATFALFLIYGKVPLSKEIILDVRLPEALLSFSAGAILSIGGGVFQGIFRNPLADPYILGVSAGSALGATLAIMYRFPPEFLSFSLSIATVGVIAIAGYTLKDNLRLLLFGVMLNAFLSAIILFIYATIPSENLQSAIYFTLGFIPPISLKSSLEMLLISIAMAILFIPVSERLNAVSMGDLVSYFSGISPSVEKLVYITVTSAITSVLVSKTGIIGFVGIVIPNALRLTGIRNFKKIIPLSFLTGGTFLMASQLIARNALSPIQLPVGVITAILGSPIFAIVLWRHSKIVKN